MQLSDGKRLGMTKLRVSRNVVRLIEMSVLGSLAVVSAAQAQSPAAKAIDRSLLDKYCVTCHGGKLKTAGLDLDKVDANNVSGNAEVLEKVVRKLRSRQMPPDGVPRPDQATLDKFAATLETALDQAAAAAPNPGKVAAHRLNRAEYVNVIHDLLALDIDGAELLPSDLAGAGFDDNADVLSITPGLFSRYMSAATKISRVAMASPDNRAMTRLYRVEIGSRQDARMGEDMPFATHGGLAVRHTFPLDGEYVFKIRLKHDLNQGTVLGIEEDTSRIELSVDDALLKQFPIGGEIKGPDPGGLIAVPEDDLEGAKVHNYRLNADKSLEIRVPVKAGTRLVAAAFSDSLPAPLEASRRRAGQVEDSSIGIDTLEISGPFNGKAPQQTPSRQRILVCRPATAAEEEPCAHKIIATLARRAYRRPVQDSDIAPLLAIYKQGRKARDFDAGIERALEALLSLPKFLLVMERTNAGGVPGSVYRVSDLELASRLSLFLWRSIPDDQLLDVAERGKLSDPGVLSDQVRRMLADRRAVRFMDDFQEQWLQIRNLHSQQPDRVKFPDFDPTLRESMARETELFFESQLREDRPISELLTANYTYLNEQLARHYGIDNIYGSHFRRVTLTDERRFGLLGKASVLTVSSYVDRTSVVLRGKWILENLLGTPPRAPPPNVPPLKENDGKSKPLALRERMEEHRKSAVCASCHAQMDPLGFVLENYDATGRWRENDQGAAINSTVNWSGKTINTPQMFREALLSRNDQFLRTVTEKLMTYALGREADYVDAPTIRKIDRYVAANGDRWSALIMGIIKSAPFEMRRVPPATITVAEQR
jgi:mono/diheme cytochrome c family protein